MTKAGNSNEPILDIFNELLDSQGLTQETIGKIEDWYASQEQDTAIVSTVAPLTADQKKRLSEALQKKYGKAIAIENEIDAKILGGMRIKLGSEVIDASLAHSLELIKAELIESL